MTTALVLYIIFSYGFVLALIAERDERGFPEYSVLIISPIIFPFILGYMLCKILIDIINKQ